MKNKMNKLSAVTYVFFILIALVGCKSVPQKISEGIYVMIYDYENHALKDVKITLNGKLLALSDIYGRAIIVPDFKGSTTIIFEKNGYEIYSIEINEKEEQLLYVKMGSASYFSTLSEKNLDAGEYEEAIKNIDKALKIEKRSDYEYLRNVIKGRIQ